MTHFRCSLLTLHFTAFRSVSKSALLEPTRPTSDFDTISKHFRLFGSFVLISAEKYRIVAGCLEADATYGNTHAPRFGTFWRLFLEFQQLGSIRSITIHSHLFVSADWHLATRCAAIIYGHRRTQTLHHRCCCRLVDGAPRVVSRVPASFQSENETLWGIFLYVCSVSILRLSVDCTNRVFEPYC